MVTGTFCPLQTISNGLRLFLTPVTNNMYNGNGYYYLTVANEVTPGYMKEFLHFGIIYSFLSTLLINARTGVVYIAPRLPPTPLPEADLVPHPLLLLDRLGLLHRRASSTATPPPPAASSIYWHASSAAPPPPPARLPGLGVLLRGESSLCPLLISNFLQSLGLAVRPGVAGLLTGEEYLRIRDNTWHVLFLL